MLADDILAETGHPVPQQRTYELTGYAIRQAQRFVLEQDIVHAACNVSDAMPSSILKGLPLCRLPFHRTWFEYAGHDRPGQPRDGTSVPHRVGMLVESPPKSTREFLVSVFWKHDKRRPCEVCPVSLILDFSAEGLLAKDPHLAAQKFGVTEDTFASYLSGRGHPGDLKILHRRGELEAALAFNEKVFFIPSPYFALLGTAIAEKMGSETIRKILLDSQSDAENEISILLGTLMLLNSKNGTQREKKDTTKLSRARIKRGNLPLLEHWTLKLKISRIRENALRNRGLSKTEIRAHIVRGHFKIRKTGIYWWSPFVRGDAKRGMVNKDYSVRV